MLNTAYSWTGTIETDVNALMKAINDNTVTTDVSARLWYANNASGTFYLQLYYTQPGNWKGQSLSVYVNGTVNNASVKRTLGYGTAKGSDIVGSKRYELANHLGNVLSVITDRKWAVDDGKYNTTTGVKISATLDGQPDYYVATIMSFSDYDPFGTIQDVRKGGDPNYRFGYQGSEKDDEIKGEGNSYTTEFRQLDPRLGRWMTTDPITRHNLTPFNAMSNNPITNIDPNGNTDYYNRRGKWIGTDGIANGERKLVLSRATAKIIKNATRHNELISMNDSENGYRDIVQIVDNTTLDVMDDISKKTQDSQTENAAVVAKTKDAPDEIIKPTYRTIGGGKSVNQVQAAKNVEADGNIISFDMHGHPVGPPIQLADGSWDLPYQYEMSSPTNKAGEGAGDDLTARETKENLFPTGYTKPSVVIGGGYEFNGSVTSPILVPTIQFYDKLGKRGEHMKLSEYKRIVKRANKNYEKKQNNKKCSPELQ